MHTQSTVAVINYNTRDQLARCLESLRHLLGQVIVFDNCSTDGSAAMVRSRYPKVRLVVSVVNLGYGAAANRALASIDTPIVVLANSDVQFAPDSMDRLELYLTEHPDVGVVGPRLLNTDGTLQRSCFPWPGGLRWLADNDAACGLLRFVPGAKSRLLRLWDHMSIRDVPWVKGAVLAIRKKAFDEIKGFDESFFMYYEETDLCRRLTSLGWSVRFAPVTELVHEGGASTSTVRTDMAVEQFASSIRFAQRHYSPLHTAFLLVFWRCIMAARLIRDSIKLMTCRDKVRREDLKGETAAWRRALGWRIRQLGTDLQRERTEVSRVTREP